MRKMIVVTVLAALWLASCQTLPPDSSRGAAPPPSSRAYIPFADLQGTIRGWSNDGDALIIETSRGRWYRAEMFSRCPSLRHAITIGFVTEPLGQIDRFSSIITDEGERCWFRSFEELPGRPERMGRERRSE